VTVILQIETAGGGFTEYRFKDPRSAAEFLAGYAGLQKPEPDPARSTEPRYDLRDGLVRQRIAVELLKRKG